MRCAFALALAVSLVAADGAGAATPGDRLVFERHCGADGSTTSIIPDPSLSRAVDVLGDTGGVSTANGVVIVLGVCSENGELTIRVPPAFPVTIDALGPGDFDLGDLDGPVTAHLNGGGALEAGRIGGGLTLDNTGDGDVRVGSLGRNSVLDLHGSGDLSVGHVEASSIVISSTSSGDVALGNGQIRHLTATLSGSGDLAVGATVLGGDLVTTGAGDISIERATGALVETRTGSGDIVVRHREGGVLTPTIRISAPPAPAMPQIGIDDGQKRSGHHWLVHLVMLIALVGGGVLLWRRGRRRAAGSATASDPRVLAAAERLETLGRRVGRLEALVTSQEFDLDRRFREMGD